MKPICFYHKADLDGVCSGAIVKHFVPDVELVGFDYGEVFPWGKLAPVFQKNGIKGNGFEPGGVKRTVYMVDVSLPADDMKKLAEFSNLIWIDHHKKAIDEMHSKPLPPMRHFCKVGFAACELCWAWFNDHVEDGAFESITVDPDAAPEAVRLLGAYDVWRKDDPEWESKILPFQMGARALEGVYNPESPIWFWLLHMGTSHPQNCVRGPLVAHLPLGTLINQPDWQPETSIGSGNATGEVVGWAQTPGIIQHGRSILRYQAEVNRRACETGAHEIRLWWRPGQHVTAVACNVYLDKNDNFFDSVYDPERHDVAVAYFQLKDGRWKVSLRSRTPGFNSVGDICKTFGGGGHPQAGNFICDKLPWETT